MLIVFEMTDKQPIQTQTCILDQLVSFPKGFSQQLGRTVANTVDKPLLLIMFYISSRLFAQLRNKNNQLLPLLS